MSSMHLSRVLSPVVFILTLSDFAVRAPFTVADDAVDTMEPLRDASVGVVADIVDGVSEPFRTGATEKD